MRDTRKREIEILAPAGTYACFQAAMNAGADAVYAAGERFGARAFAGNFSGAELLTAIEEAHVYGKKLYLTVNTLVKPAEYRDLYAFLLPLYEHGLDAVIVQDVGVLEFIRREFPGLDLHASTQMSITGGHGAALLESAGASRIVPARELSLSEIRHLREETRLEIECFVHGALCYCYSGQCLQSSLNGGRSGNRGQCAQPCRLPYTVDGVKKYYLSMKDICTLEYIPDLADAGIDSFKIEGRMRKTEYVAAAVSLYKQYTEEYMQNGREKFHVRKKDLQMLMDIYNRGDLCGGYYTRTARTDGMLAKEKPNHMGVPAAKFVSQQAREVCARAVTELYAQDVLETAGGKQNYTLGHAVKTGDTFRFLVPSGVRFKKGTVFRRIRCESLIRKINEEYSSEKRKEPIFGRLSLHAGQPAVLTVFCREYSYTAKSAVLPEAAKSAALESDSVLRQLGKTGQTIFTFSSLELDMDEGLFFPAKELNTLRRNALDGLYRMLAERTFRTSLKNTEPETEKESANNRQARLHTQESKDANKHKKILPNPIMEVEKKREGRVLASKTESTEIPGEEAEYAEMPKREENAPEIRAGETPGAGYSVYVLTEEQLSAVAAFVPKKPAASPCRIYLDFSLFLCCMQNRKKSMHSAGASANFEHAQIDSGHAPADFCAVSANSSRCAQSLSSVSETIHFLKKNGVSIWLCLPRILREKEKAFCERACADIRRADFGGFMIFNYESADFLKVHGFDKPFITAHNLYVCSPYAEKFWQKRGAAETTVQAEEWSEIFSHSMNAEQIVYGRLPVMVTAQCIAAASSGCKRKPEVKYLTDGRRRRYPVINHCEFCYNMTVPSATDCSGGSKPEPAGSYNVIYHHTPLKNFSDKPQNGGDSRNADIRADKGTAAPAKISLFTDCRQAAETGKRGKKADLRPRLEFTVESAAEVLSILGEFVRTAGER